MKRLKCTQVKRIVTLQEPAAWPIGLRDAIEAHMADCPSCRRELALSDLVREALRQTPTYRAPAGFAPSVMGKIAEREILRSRRWPHRLVAWSNARAVLAAAAVAVMLVGSTLVYLRYQGDVMPSPPVGHGGVHVPTYYPNPRSEVGQVPPEAKGEMDQSPRGDASLVEQLIFYHEQAALHEIGTDAGILMARGGP
ncbi:MAG: hypothetical protein N2512_10615 [Armatimonadetes bacterium]|nr:hypothetical protein [Armatimonadota bacterium]